MRRSMNDIGGGEDDEIQQAIRLSLQELGMTYSQENQGENAEQEVREREHAPFLFCNITFFSGYIMLCCSLLCWTKLPLDDHMADKELVLLCQ